MKYTVTLNERQEAKLEELASKLGTTKADVVREALALFSVIVRETASGNKSVQIRDLDKPDEPGQVLISASSA